MTKKFILGLVVCLWMAIGTNAWADLVSGDYRYTVTEGKVTITFYIGSGGDVVIPDTIEGMPVVSIRGFAYQSRTLTSVTIPDSVTNIGEGAFYYSGYLTSVTIGKGVASIGRPRWHPFEGCWSLTNITVDADNPVYSSLDGVMFNKDQTTLVLCPEGRSGSFTIPAGVTSIGDYGFTSCDIAFVTIPDSVISIGALAFSSCHRLTSVTIPDNVESIGAGAFQGCRQLTNVTIGNNVTSIGESAFQGTPLTNAHIPASVTSIGDSAFADSAVTDITADANNSVYSSDDGVLYNKDKTVLAIYPSGRSGQFTIPFGVTSIGEYAFNGCGRLTGVTIPSSVTTIEGWNFVYCGLTSITIPDSVITIGNYSFNGCLNLTTATIGDGVTSIGEGAFESCWTLADLTLGNSLATIGGNAFNFCEILTSVAIPESVSSIGEYAFAFCENLSIATFLGDAPLMGEYIFDDSAPDFQICYTENAAGFTTPLWEPTQYDSYPAAACACSYDSDCSESQECSYGSCELISRPGSWAWMSGSEIRRQSGVYGTKGVDDGTNIPGARDRSISWTDNNDNLWLFGGYGYDSAGNLGYLNDLWHYDFSTANWIWMGGANTINQGSVYGTKGTPDIINVPGARSDSISWTDSTGNLWLFGGFGHIDSFNKGLLDDLWRYDISTGEWTWMSGSDSVNQIGVYVEKNFPFGDDMPGGRIRSVTWTDNDDNLWLFGGWGGDSVGDFCYLNDLWYYDRENDGWVWMSGSELGRQPGIYGTKGVADYDNTPGARDRSISWSDNSDNFWLFGGVGYDNTNDGTAGYLNDLWTYNPDTNMWTWMSGANTKNQMGAYGTKGTPSLANVPGARWFSISWTGYDGTLWLFGGFTDDVNGDQILLNDLWRYDMNTGEWIWISGSDTADQAGVYGTKGTPDTGNISGARGAGISWTRNDGNLWLFGGVSYDGIGSESGLLNDLWRYDVPLLCTIDTDCPEGYECFYGTCAPIPDDPPTIDNGPFLAAGPWPILPTDPDIPMVVGENYSVMWTFSDEYNYTFCDGQCTYKAEYQAVGDADWTELDVDADLISDSYAGFELPVETTLQNATTYAVRFTVTDCALQSTQSGLYYFRVAKEDNPPVLEAGPFLAAGPWPIFKRSAETAFTLAENYDVVWTFSDDYASCENGLCTHRFKYRKVGTETWTRPTPIEGQSGEISYAYFTLPVSSLENGTYEFNYTVLDCIGQNDLENVHYFKVSKP